MGLFSNTYMYSLAAGGSVEDLNVLGWWEPECPYELYDTSDSATLLYSLVASIFTKSGVGYLDLSMTNVEEINSGNMEITQFFLPIIEGSNMGGMFKVQVVVSLKGMINKTMTVKLEVTGFEIPKKSQNTREKFDTGFAELQHFLAPYGFK